MKIVCLVKIIPDVEHFTYDYEKNILVRENKKSIVNPEDSCAVAAALMMKEKYGGEVTVVSMGPVSNQKYLENFIRCGADRAVLISDEMYRGSDTYVTSRILAKGIEVCGFDLIIGGTHSLDGDTGQVLPQVAEHLDAEIMSHVTGIRRDERTDRDILVEAEDEEKKLLFSISLPAVIGISGESEYKLPYIRYDDRKKDVSDRLKVLTNRELCFGEGEIGLAGSRTRVLRTWPKKFSDREKKVVQNDEAGIEYVYQFLREKGFLNDD